MSSIDKHNIPLNKHVITALETYLSHLDGHRVSNLYQMVLKEVEVPLLKTILDYTKNNQSETATLLGISRGTLRKKLKQYKLIMNCK